MKMTYAGLGCVIKVIDGDTLIVHKYEGDEEICVRLIGVDAPEKGEPYYGEAKAFLEGVFESDQKVKLYLDGPVKDKYNRLRAHVYTEVTSVLVSEKLLEYGYAKILKVHSHLHEDLFIEARKEAFQNKMGKWGEE